MPLDATRQKKTLTIAERVQNGIMFLDNNMDPDWRSRVDLERLDISSGNCCMLAQLFGDFGRGCVELGIDTVTDQAMSLGFECGDNQTDEDEWREYHALSNEWRKQLTNGA